MMRTESDEQCESYEDGEIVTGGAFSLSLDSEVDEGGAVGDWLLINDDGRLVSAVEFCPLCGGRLE